MNYNAETYQFIHYPSEKEDAFYFVSVGEKIIVKTIAYTQLEYFAVHKEHPLFNKRFFNLGFGDDSDSNHEIIDNVVSNNGDVFKVFNTVLKTVPIFFNHHRDCAIMIRGSDSNNDYEKNCRPTCKKKCTSLCKNVNRRINIYKSYINKNYELLSGDYNFYGGIINHSGITMFTVYELKNNYDFVTITKK